MWQPKLKLCCKLLEDDGCFGLCASPAPSEVLMGFSLGTVEYMNDQRPHLHPWEPWNSTCACVLEASHFSAAE